MANRVQNTGWCRVILLVLVVALWACVAQPTTGGLERPPTLATGPETEAPPVTWASDWQAVEQLIAERKYQAATEVVARLRGQAQAASSTAEWTRALVKEVQLTAALGGVETAVRLLRETPWPAGEVERTVLTLLYGHSLARYLDVYGWEIGQRERVASAGDVDLKQWTRAQIVTAIDEAYSGLWAEREAWGAEPIGELAEYLEQNDYPARIRGTLRDVVTYLWAEFLANTAYWAPEESNTVYRLDVAALAAGEASTNAGQHPLGRLAAVLADLERWHRAEQRPEAAFEAMLERLRRLESNLTRAADRALVRQHLESALAALGRRYAWWSMGQAQLARMVQAEAGPDSLVEARELARAGRDAHPESVGGRRCASLVAGFEAPGLGLESMSSDGLGQRSLLLRHKNLDTVFFRAYSLALEATLTESQDYNLLPNQRHIDALLARSEPSHRWRLELPATPDLRQHQTFVTPPFEEPGLYVVVASAREDFRREGNKLLAVDFIASDLVLLAQTEDGRVRLDVRSGASGEALADVEVALWRLEYRTSHRRVGTARTGSDGRALLAHGGGRLANAIVIARRGDDVNFERVWVGGQRRSAPSDSTEALIFTDRSIYRPEQEVLWKVVAYDRSSTRQRLRAATGRALTIELLDANWEIVASVEVESNDFGSAAGSFTIPSGRLLGGWQLRTSLGGQAQIQVEEYKRPTFEVTLNEPPAALRLNRAARLVGEASYYFGLPVVDGAVEWRVSRRPRYPEWWGWFRPVPSRSEELVAGGETRLDADGHFAFEFTPEADEREARQGVTYSYAVTVEVTDAGGETRSAARTYRLGYVTIEARIDSDRGFFDAGGSAAFEVRRADLDGTPRAGTGRWRLARLELPVAVTLPAEEPVASTGGEARSYRTPGDALRPRWSSGYVVAGRLRGWRAGSATREGTVEHDDEGLAVVDFDALETGAYRLYYETEDPFGARFETQHEFLVGGDSRLPLPLLLRVDRSSVPAGETARLLVHSGLPGQQLLLEIARPGQGVEELRLTASGTVQALEVPIREADRGGVWIRLTTLRDHQLLTLQRQIFVPPEERDLEVRFESFRDLLRPGSRETWRVVVRGADEETLTAGAAEVLGYMYDRSLDLFADHHPPRPRGFSAATARLAHWMTSLGVARPVLQRESDWYQIPRFPHLRGDRLRFFDSYGIGGPGRGGVVRRAMAPQAMAVEAESGDMVAAETDLEEKTIAADAVDAGEPPADGPPPADGGGLRTDFSETAFWEPHLVTDAEGAVAFEFTVPDSLTEWNVWVHALTRDLRVGSLHQRVRTVKELLVRPYLPRFLREGDEALLRIVVQNAGTEPMTGELSLDLLDPATDVSVAAEFGLAAADREGLPFDLEAGGSATLTVPLRAPRRVGSVAVRVVGSAGDFSDGELRLLPLLPGRFHLAQSRFAALQDADRRELIFEELAADSDPTRIDEQLVVTIDAQLFYSVLNALPYLVDYPYECTEQTLNRFLSTGIVSSVFDDYPAVARMAAELATRDTRLAPWVSDDPNRRMALEETPWLRPAAGGEEIDADLLRVLDPRVASAQRDSALAKLRNAQTSLGGFPWWPGGPPSPFMTLYIASGLSRALEFGVEVPRDVVVGAWRYLHRHYVDELARDLGTDKGRYETVTFLNYVLSSYPDASWTGGVFSDDDTRRMLAHSFDHWRRHSPLLKSYLALTLARAGRDADARLVFDSVMDSARTTEDEGTFWAPEDRAWLWYNDTIEGHAFALRALGELTPDDERRQGLVHWLMLNKKLNHWKSTRATAEVIYALVHYLSAEGQLGQREVATVHIGATEHELTFEPDHYTGANRQLVLTGSEIDPKLDSKIVVEKETPGLLFASATWHFSTEQLPTSASGDFFEVERRYFKRARQGQEWTLEPLAERARLEVGDQIEVHLSLHSKHAAEYVHLRDPRAAGFEPETLTSRYKWDLGIGWYEQVRDSGTDFFFERLPVGEYTFKYRLRASLGGTFKAAPATAQSMYAPEFNAYSSGATLSIVAD